MKEDIIRMARDAGMLTWLNPPEDVTERFERFAALVRAAEREACAKVCDEQAKLWSDEGGDAGTCAIYIRERGGTHD
jgi:acyl-CoA reductase-like NAD-dependent aldehyde dehydrogenase